MNGRNARLARKAAGDASTATIGAIEPAISKGIDYTRTVELRVKSLERDLGRLLDYAETTERLAQSLAAVRARPLSGRFTWLLTGR